MACLVPATASIVLLMRSSRAGVNTYEIEGERSRKKEKSNLDPKIVRNLSVLD
jgi:hypothetical protein